MTTSTSNQSRQRPMWQVLLMLAAAVLASIFAGGIQQYGSVPLGHATLMTDLVVGAIGLTVVLPGINVAIASIWESKRSSRSRRNIYFWWGIAVTIAQLLILSGKLGEIGSSNPTLPSGQATTSSTALKDCTIDGNLAFRFATERDDSVSRAENRRQIESVVTDRDRKERVNAMLDWIYASTEMTPEVAQNVTFTECMNARGMAVTEGKKVE